MLKRRAADMSDVVHRVIVTVAFACCALVLASFVMFTRDQLAGASKQQQNALVSNGPTTSAPTPVATKKPQAQPGRFIDGAASTLTSPFRSVVQSDNQWVVHGLATAFALLAYGAGLGFLARYSRGFS
jgi:hypothetical protein